MYVHVQEFFARPPLKRSCQILLAVEKFVCLEVPNASPLALLVPTSRLAVMDDFVLKVHLPQLQEKVTQLFCILSMLGTVRALIWSGSAVTKSLIGIYAFQPDSTTSRLSHQPLFKATTQIDQLPL